MMPLDFMLQVLRNKVVPKNASLADKIAAWSIRFEAAKAAAPYLHPRLSSIEFNGAVDVTTHEDLLERLK